MNEKLFPPYLNSPFSGDTDFVEGVRGPAVFVVKCLLIGFGYNCGFALNQEFCKYLTKAIKLFQEDNGIDADGNFGPATRKAFDSMFNTNLDMIERDVLYGKDFALQPEPNGKIKEWPV